MKLGIAINWQHDATPEVARILRELGVKSVLIQGTRRWLEDDPTKLDRFEKAARFLHEEGFELMVRVGGMTWGEINSHAPIEEWREKSTKSTKQVARRLGSICYLYQVGNEPNGEIADWTTPTWRAWHGLITDERDQIRMVNSQALIIGAGLAGGTGERGTVEWIDRYLRLIENEGAKLPWRVAAFHPWDISWDLRYYGRWRHRRLGIGARARTIRGLLNERGHYDIQIWITELGRRVVRDQPLRSPLEQRHFLLDAVIAAAEADVERVYWWELRGPYVPPGEVGPTSPLILDGEPSLAYETFGALCQIFNR